MHKDPLFISAGNQAMVVELGNYISSEISGTVHKLALTIDKACIPGILDVVPTYRSLLINYDPMTISNTDLQDNIQMIYADLDDVTNRNPCIVQIPTRYGGQYGPDFEYVMEHTKLTKEDIIKIHSGTDYILHMLGFTPGFPYLGGLSKRLITPRLKTPRTHVSAGSVGIGNDQTGIYPIDSPGGWNLIGKTPLKLFDPNLTPPTPLELGDHIRFVPIDTEEEYENIRDQVENNTYSIVREATR